MNSIQYIYPFDNLIDLPDNIIRQIEIEFPQVMPIKLIENFDNDKLFSFERDSESIYTVWITDAEVLEGNDLEVIFDQLKTPQYKYAIVNILYEEQ